MKNLPLPNIIDPSSVPSLRWGILGAGGIARTWAGTVLTNTSQRITAVASRTPGKAEEFARDLGIERSYSSYDELVEQPDIDAIYIASYPSDHKEHALLAIAAGKHVLIEKPTTMNSGDAAYIFALASAAGVLAMEAMWTRYLPQNDIARQLLADGALGDLDLLVATFCQDNRHLERMWTKGGGSPVFDMGIYPIAFAQMFLGNPTNITAFGVVREDLIEEEAHVLMTYEDSPPEQTSLSPVAPLFPTLGPSLAPREQSTLVHPLWFPPRLRCSIQISMTQELHGRITPELWVTKVCVTK